MDESEVDNTKNVEDAASKQIVTAQVIYKPPKKKWLTFVVLSGVILAVLIFTFIRFGTSHNSNPASAPQMSLNSVCNSVDNNSLLSSMQSSSIDSTYVVNSGDIVKSNAESIFARLISKQPFIIEYVELYFDDNIDTTIIEYLEYNFDDILDTTDYSRKSFYLRKGYRVDENSKKFIDSLPLNSIFRAKVGTQNKDLDDYGVELSNGLDSALRAPSSVLYDVTSATLSDVVDSNSEFEVADSLTAFMMEFRDDSAGFQRSIEVAQNGFVIYKANGINGEITTFLTNIELGKLESILAKNNLFPDTESNDGSYSSFQIACSDYFEYSGSSTGINAELQAFLSDLGERLEQSMKKQFKFLTVESVYEWDYADIFVLEPNSYYKTSTNVQYDAIYKRMSEDEKSTFPAGSGGLTYVSDGTYYHVSSYLPDSDPFFRATDLSKINTTKNVIVVDMPKEIAKLPIQKSSNVAIGDVLYESQRSFFEAARGRNTSNSKDYKYYLLDGNLYSQPKLGLTYQDSHIE